MKSRIIHKFYEPVVLLKALNLEMTDMAEHTNPAKTVDNKNPKELFEVFVYKLAHMCDNMKGDGGATVTSFMVTQDGDGQYPKFWFASNQRTEEELKQTASFTKTLLEMIGEGHIENREYKKELQRNLLRHVLRFNTARIALYIQDIRIEAQKCLKKCSDFTGDERILMTTALEEILEVSSSGMSTTSAEQVLSFEQVLNTLERVDRSSLGESLSTLARDVRESPNESMACWPEMRHMMNRLLAYPEAINFFLVAKKTWPRLFEEPHVSFIRSSVPIPRPGRNKSFSAAGIIGRMTRREKDIEIFRRFVQELQLFNLDDRIKTEYEDKEFRPIVHAEILLLNELELLGPISPARFFQGWMYIGSSKPTCKLCHYYFEEHRSTVGHRPSHNNLYIAWRFPDVFQSQGSDGVNNRQVMVDRMLLRIRKDAFDLIRKRVKPTYRDHDSATSSARLTNVHILTNSEIDDVMSMMGELDMSEDETEGGVRL